MSEKQINRKKWENTKQTGRSCQNGNYPCFHQAVSTVLFSYGSYFGVCVVKRTNRFKEPAHWSNTKSWSWNTADYWLVESLHHKCSDVADWRLEGFCVRVVHQSQFRERDILETHRGNFFKFGPNVNFNLRMNWFEMNLVAEYHRSRLLWPQKIHFGP